MAFNKIRIAADGDGIILKGSYLDDMLTGGTGAQFLYGGAGNDLVIAGTGDQQIYGGSGNDTVVVGHGNQYLDGGSGIDTLDFSHINGSLEVAQGARTAKVFDVDTGALLYTDTILSFDKIIGGSHDDVFKGQMLRGASFDGGAGDDTFLSKNGGDVVTGGDGADTFTWTRKFLATGVSDRVTDFDVGTDKLDLSDFLGQGFLDPVYDQVVRLSDVIEADGSHSTKVTALVNERWADVVVLEHIDVSTVSLQDLGLV